MTKCQSIWTGVTIIFHSLSSDIFINTPYMVFILCLSKSSSLFKTPFKYKNEFCKIFTPALGLSGFLSGWHSRAFSRYAFLICQNVWTLRSAMSHNIPNVESTCNKLLNAPTMNVKYRVCNRVVQHLFCYYFYIFWTTA